jgi:hypothetical protein
MKADCDLCWLFPFCPPVALPVWVGVKEISSPPLVLATVSQVTVFSQLWPPLEHPIIQLLDHFHMVLNGAYQRAGDKTVLFS